MSVLNRSHRFVFVHVPKSAGTSVTSVLSRYTRIGDVEIGGTPFGETLAVAYAARFGLYKHNTARELRSAIGAEVFRESFSFGFVRNPYARAFSIFTFLKHHFRAWKGSEKMDEFESFDQFVGADFFHTDGPDRLLRPQLFWLRTSDDDQTPLVDFVGRVERLADDMREILLRIEANVGSTATPSFSVPRANASADPDAWRSAYSSAETRSRVHQRYEADFRAFGYSPEAWTGA